MKHLFKLLLAVVPCMLLSVTSCDKTDDREVTIEADKTTITADGSDTVTFTVKYGDEEVSSGFRILLGGEEISGATFKSETAGVYKFTAEYKEKTSKEITVTAVEPTQTVVTLSVDKTTVTGDGTDKAVFTVKAGDEDVTAESKIYRKGGEQLPGNEFTSTVVGSYDFYALYDDVESNTVTVTVEAAAAGSLLLSVDKAAITADGVDEARFTVMRDGVDITDQCNVCMPSGQCLMDPVFRTEEIGEHVFYASLLSDGTVKSNNVTVTAVAAAELVLLVDKTTITADNVDEARFTVTQDGVDITDQCNVCMPSGQCLMDPVFKTDEVGEHVFYASLLTDGTVRSNTVTITATKPDEPAELVLSVSKTTIKGNNADEAVFTVKLNGDDVTSSARITYGGGNAIDGNKFSAYDAGEYEFKAEYEEYESNTVKIKVEAVELVLTTDRGVIQADGNTSAQLTVMFGDTDVTNAVTIKGPAGQVYSNPFSSTTVGEYVMYAELNAYPSIKSNEISIEVSEVKVLEISVDKTLITSDGADQAVFTVTYGGLDVTSSSRINAGGTYLSSNIFTTTTAGTYSCYAEYREDGVMVSDPVTVRAKAPAPVDNFDASKTLHKNVGYFTFTASWCGPCYSFKGYLKNLMADYGNNIVQVNFYSGNSEAQVNSSLTNTFINQLSQEGRFSVSGYPTCIAELRQELGTPGYVPTEAQVRAAYNTYIAYPAKTGIKINSAVGVDKIEVDVTVGAKEAGTYYIGVLLVEDNIVAYQNGGGNNYNHTDVLRDRGMNSIFGEDLGTVSAGQSIDKNYVFNIESKYNTDNMSVVVYVLYEDNGNKVITNIVKAPADGFTGFKYTN